MKEPFIRGLFSDLELWQQQLLQKLSQLDYTKDYVLVRTRKGILQWVEIDKQER